MLPKRQHQFLVELDRLQKAGKIISMILFQDWDDGYKCTIVNVQQTFRLLAKKGYVYWEPWKFSEVRLTQKAIEYLEKLLEAE